jgi:hypothetical protein
MTVDLETLIALEEIKRLKALYCQCVDQHRWEELASLFVEEAELTTDRESKVNTMRGRDLTAEGVWTASYTNENGPVTGHGHYIERYEKRDGRWRYTHMTLRVHFLIRP